MKEEFNLYCAEIMGYECHGTNRGHYVGQCWHVTGTFNPYDDLNQMAEVVERLLKNERIPKALNIFSGEDIEQAFRDFIISTKEKE